MRVSHDMNVEMSVSGSSMTTDSNATSTKVWKVKETRPDGTATFEHMVEDVEMKNDASGHMPTHYSSRSDAKPPAGYETVAKSVGVPLINITMILEGRSSSESTSRKGRMQNGKIDASFARETDCCWRKLDDSQYDRAAHRRWGIKRIRTRQVFTLNELKDGIAVIHMERQILSPIDPTTEVKLIQGESTGTIRFDIDPGRVVSQEAEVDRRVLGFRGPTSSIHLRTLFTEKLVADGETKTAGTAVSENKPKRLSEARLPARTNAAAEPVSAVADIKIGSVEGRSQEPKVQRSALAATDIPQHAVDASESRTPPKTGRTRS